MSILKRINLYLPLITLFIELFAILSVAVHYKSNCIQAQEIAVYAYVFILFLYPFMLSDIVYFVVTSWLHKNLAIRPFGVFYHTVGFIMCLAGSITLISGLTFCGNIAQVFFGLASAHGIIAGVLHIINAVTTRELLPEDMKFARHYS